MKIHTTYVDCDVTGPDAQGHRGTRAVAIGFHPEPRQRCVVGRLTSSGLDQSAAAVLHISGEILPCNRVIDQMQLTRLMVQLVGKLVNCVAPIHLRVIAINRRNRPRHTLWLIRPKVCAQPQLILRVVGV